MPTAIREQLLFAITTAVNGEYGIPAPESERDLPVCIVDDGLDQATDDIYNLTNVVTLVAVARAEQATSSDRTVMRDQANNLLANIISDLFVDETFGGLADGVDYTGGGIQTEIGKFVFAEAQFNVRWHHLRGDPFALE